MTGVGLGRRAGREIVLTPLLACLLVASAAGCAHRFGSGKLSEPSKRLHAEAAALKSVDFEEDYVNARLIYRALPRYASERPALRQKLVTYLLGPVGTVDPRSFRGGGGGGAGANDDLDRIMASFREALDLYTPEDLWARGGPRLPDAERALLIRTSNLVATVFATRGAEVEVATALLVLQTLEPKNRVWSARLAELFPWLETGAQLSLTGAGPRGVPTPTDALESIASVWVAPNVVEPLAEAHLRRQDRLSALLRRPLGTVQNRSAIGELLLEGDTVQGTAIKLAGLYLRAGQLERANQVLARAAGKPGDDPELRQLMTNAARSKAGRNEALALARRFLPRIDVLGGTSNDAVDLGASLEVLIAAAEKFPQDAEIRVLASRVAFLTQDVFLSLRFLEEAQPLLDKAGAAREEQAALAAELLERSFLKLKQRIGDTERLGPATREAELLRQRLGENRRRFGDDRLKNRNAEIDVELAKGLLNAGQVVEAEALLVRAVQSEDAGGEAAIELAKLAMKRGDPRRAAELLERELEHQSEGEGQETIPQVEMQSKLAYALGNAHEVAGRQDEARKAWRVALRGWERLMVEHLRRKNVGDAAEATMEVGRLTYLLGRQSDGVAKFVEAIEQNDARDQSYIDALSFLVQRGDVEAALDIYRRAMSRPSRTVSEYVKVYSSMWIADLTRRAGRGVEPSAEAYLRELASRRVHLRPQRVVGWYTDLARFSLGMLSYEQLLPRANNAGKRAELYFYEAMRRLASGQSDDAHDLWNKVLQTHMVEFLEFDMASRYLRTGAPTRATKEDAPGGEAI
jgi:tetratricopeptide (TPR) repeat protein